MRPLYRALVFLFLLLMFQSPIRRLYQTSRHLIKVIPDAVSQRAPELNMSRPTGLIANKGLELLTFGSRLCGSA